MAGAIDQAATCNDGLQVRGDRPRRLVDRISMGDHPLLDGAAGVASKQGKAHIEAEYDRWHAPAIHAPSPVERPIVDGVGKVKTLASHQPQRGKRRAG